MFDGLQPLAYDLIMSDPPWAFQTYSDKGQGKGPANQYDVMGLDAIKALPVQNLARGDCLLWLWATHPMLPQAIDVVRCWGFRYVTSGVWVKRSHSGKLAFGTGYRLRSASEPFIIAVLGNPETAKNVRTVVEGPVREHSRKPDEAYAAAEHLCPKAIRRLDMFSRQSRPGWEAWGAETGKFDEVLP